MATLSVVFAFVFAPAGLILGHLGLAQIRRSGERGRDRALVGVTLSYVFITVAVIALIVRATLPDTTPTHIAAPATTTTTARTPTTTTTSPPPPPPTVAPADVDGLLANLEDVKSITGDPAMKPGRAIHQPEPDKQRGYIDRPECWPVIDVGGPEAYDLPTISGFAGSDFADNHDAYHQWVAGQAVAVFHDAAAAQAQLTKLLAILHRCGGSTLNATWPNGKTYPVLVQPPADGGKGITILASLSQTPIRIFCVQGVAAKANVSLETVTCSTDSTDRTQQATSALTNLILGRIPG